MCKTRGSKRESTSHGSVITYNNPNYNGVDALNQADGRADSHKPTFLKRLKYDRGQVSLYIGGFNPSTTSGTLSYLEIH